MDLSSRAHPLSSSMARPFLPLPPPGCPRSFLDLPHRLRYLYPNSPSFSLSFSVSLLQSVPFSVYVSHSLEQPLLACRFFSFPLPPPPRRCRRSSPSVGSRPRPFVPYRPRSPPSSPTSVLRTRTPLQKTQVQYGRNGGFLPSPPFTLFPSFLYLSLNLSSSLFLPFCSLLPSSSSVSLASRLIVLYLCLGCSFPSLLLRLASTCTWKLPLASIRALVILNHRRTQMTPRLFHVFRKIGKVILCVIHRKEFPRISFNFLSRVLPAMTSFNQVNVSFFPLRFFSLHYKIYFIFLFHYYLHIL